jgi:hypothetical protein
MEQGVVESENQGVAGAYKHRVYRLSKWFGGSAGVEVFP